MQQLVKNRDTIDFEEIKRQWLEEEPFFGDLSTKGSRAIKSPYSNLSYEERAKFLNCIKNEYELTIAEYMDNSDSEELESKLDWLTFKIIDDSMNYLLFLIDKSQTPKKDSAQLKEIDVISKVFGIRDVSDILSRRTNVCKCLNSLIREITYRVRVPPEDLENYYNLFLKEKGTYDHRKMLSRLLEEQSHNSYLTFPIVGVSAHGFKNNINYLNSDHIGGLGMGSEGYPYESEYDLVTGILKSIPANNGATIEKHSEKPRRGDPAYTGF